MKHGIAFERIQFIVLPAEVEARNFPERNMNEGIYSLLLHA